MEKETENKKPRFHITITDNATGEVMIDEEVCAIVGGVTVGKGHSKAIGLTACSPFEIAEALVDAEEVVSALYAIDSAEITRASAFIKDRRARRKNETENTETETETN